MHMHVDHTHDHHKMESSDQDVKNIRTAFFLNLFFTIVEIVGGFYTNSVAILADAIHDLGDSLALGVAWYFQKISKKGSDASFSYGYRRFSVLGALINSLVLIIGSVFILNETIPRLWNPEESNALGMIWIAVLGVLVNGIAALRLRKGSSLNERVVMLHLMEDVLGWVAVLIGAICMLIWDVPILDPILSFLIFTYILINVFRNLRKVVKIIMQGTPSNEELKKVEAYFDQHRSIKSHHDLHFWTMDGQYYIMTVHIRLNIEYIPSEITEIKKGIRKDLKEMGIDHPTIEIDMSEEDCELEDC